MALNWSGHQSRKRHRWRSISYRVAFDLTIPTSGFEIGHFRLGAGKHRVASDGHSVCYQLKSCTKSVLVGIVKGVFIQQESILYIRFNVVFNVLSSWYITSL
jgi:hypothetical protein